MPTEDWKEGGFGLYLHWPYCESKCPYCDFNSHVATGVDGAAWAAAYEAEIARTAAETPGRVLNTIYFGGGTPSLMSPELVSRVLAAALRAWTPANDIEITLEANPGSVEAAKFEDYRGAGVNRVSLGVQSLNDEDLKRLGRMHSVLDARRALEIARSAFDRMSFDLIYARQDQSRAAWRAELSEALSSAPDHLSLYQLTVEDGTVFGRRHAAGQLFGLPGEDLGVAMYEDTQDQCEGAGLSAYEVSNHAQPGQESRHNLIYWRGGDYVGVGPGAHGRVTLDGRRHATVGAMLPQAWLDRLARTGSGEVERVRLAPQERAEEYLLMGLRLREGIDLIRLAALAGKPLDPERISSLEGLGMVLQDRGRLKTTAAGRLLLNQVIAQLTA
jgi:oxygen-independent coproporphyrinogen-3 oxidase